MTREISLFWQTRDRPSRAFQRHFSWWNGYILFDLAGCCDYLVIHTETLDPTYTTCLKEDPLPTVAAVPVSRIRATVETGVGRRANIALPGNVTSKPRSPALEPQTTPTLKSHMYTTGRGGTGNMAKNDNAEEARRAQDVDVPGIIMPEGTHHTGRGNARSPEQREEPTHD